MSDTDSNSVVSRPSQGDPVEYRAISSLAVAGLLLGIASVSALAAQVLWGVPLVGAITSLAAVLRIEFVPEVAKVAKH